MQQELFLCFIDYTRVFDKVRHEVVINGLEKSNVDRKDLRRIKADILGTNSSSKNRKASWTIPTNQK
jgi:hypothetical protein